MNEGNNNIGEQLFNDIYLWSCNTLELYESYWDLLRATTTYLGAWCMAQKTSADFFQRAFEVCMDAAEHLWENREIIWSAVQKDPSFEPTLASPRWRSESHEQV